MSAEHLKQAAERALRAAKELRLPTHGTYGEDNLNGVELIVSELGVILAGLQSAEPEDDDDDDIDYSIPLNKRDTERLEAGRKRFIEASKQLAPSVASGSGDLEMAIHQIAFLKTYWKSTHNAPKNIKAALVLFDSLMAERDALRASGERVAAYKSTLDIADGYKERLQAKLTASEERCRELEKERDDLRRNDGTLFAQIFAELVACIADAAIVKEGKYDPRLVLSLAKKVRAHCIDATVRIASLEAELAPLREERNALVITAMESCVFLDDETPNKALRRALAELRARAEKAEARLKWLHTGGGRDAEGYEWGVFRVKWTAQGQPESVCQTLSDYSDLDAEIAREAAVNMDEEPKP